MEREKVYGDRFVSPIEIEAIPAEHYGDPKRRFVSVHVIGVITFDAEQIKKDHGRHAFALLSQLMELELMKMSPTAGGLFDAAIEALKADPEPEGTPPPAADAPPEPSGEVPF